VKHYRFFTNPKRTISMIGGKRNPRASGQWIKVEKWEETKARNLGKYGFGG